MTLGGDGEDDLPQAHDTVFRVLLGREAAALAAARRLLPAEIARRVARVVPERARLASGGGRQGEADLVWRAGLDDGSALRLRLLLDHRSGADRWLLVQLAGYAVRFLEADRAAGGPLLPLYTVVVFNGRRPWTGGHSLSDLYDGPALAGLPLTFGLILVNLQSGPPPPLAEPWADAGLELLALARRPPQPQATYRALFERLLRLDRMAARLALRYLATTLRGLPVEHLEAAMDEAWDVTFGVDPDTIDWARWDVPLAQKWRQARAEGRAEADRATLTRLLTRRFGPLPAAASARIAAAAPPRLELWLDRVLDGDSLDAVLSDG